MSTTARWLGQAGFLIETAADRLLIDPYLSDSLARKYAGKLFAHHRMRPAPLTVAELPNLRGVLCTHRHTDHMDPDTLAPLLAGQPETQLVCPRAVLDEAIGRSGVERSRIRALADRETCMLGDCTVTAVPSAHEERVVDADGDDAFLGYVIECPDVTLYHSGDCAPWDGLADRLREHRIDVALLPVNGRDGYRRKHGVPGNFTYNEAVSLCADAGIETLVPHHWGMFEFNTVSPDTFGIAAAQRLGVRVVVPEHGAHIDLIGNGT